MARQRPWWPDNLDLVLAALIALGLPSVAAWTFDRFGGAAVGLVLYYLVCGVGVVRWRRGTLDYGWPHRWPWRLFLPTLLLPAASAAINLGALPDTGAPTGGLLLTALVWAPLNGALEQLSWFYVLDAWRCRWPAGRRRWIGLVIGVLLLLVLVTLIHLLFWSRFLPLAEVTTWSRFSIPLNLALTVGYAALYDRARSMWPVFVVHTLVDLQLVLIANYSILPDL